jgi:regulation of enolase protein 1 (concanavalin A-like superfamily)
VNAGGESTNSVQVSATTMVEAPAGLTATAVSDNQISLTWNAVTNATSYNVKRSPTSGGSYTDIATGITATNYTDTVAAGLKCYYVVSAICSGQESPNSPEATVNLPYPWVSQDVGSLGLAGSVTFSNGVFTVTGSGDDIWNAVDAFRFVFVPVTGNCTITARVLAVQNTDGWAKAGVMIRANLNADSANALVAVTPGNGVTWQDRSSAGGSSSFNNTTGLSASYWVRLVRSGDTFTGYRSANGVTWTPLGAATISMASPVYVGLALTSHNNSTLSTAAFDHVTAPGWANWTLPPVPASLIASAGDSLVALTWTASSNATSYNVKRATTNGGAYAIVANVGTTNYTDTGLSNGTNYYYAVSALNPAGESDNSMQASATPQAPPVLSVLQGGTDLACSWPLASAGFTLQSRTNLTLGNWETVASPLPQIVGDRWKVTVSPSGNTASVFYRLAK